MFPWVVLVACAAVFAAFAIGFSLRRGRQTSDGDLVSRAERVTRLPAARRAASRRLTALAVVVALCASAAIAGGIVIARPIAAQTIVPENTNRDIMLCLDVSGSMTDIDIEVLDIFDELVDGFEGERIGLTIFNASPVQVFPLTDDYAFVKENMRSIRESLDGDYGAIPEHWAGTLEGAGSSLIGDGLAACATRFDHTDEERSRSIIFATDNELVGDPLVTLMEAAGLAAHRGVRVFAIDPLQDPSSPLSAELSQAAERTNGASYGLRGETTVGDILREVRREEARALTAEAEVVETDAPSPWILVLAIASLASVFVMWRVRL